MIPHSSFLLRTNKIKVHRKRSIIKFTIGTKCAIGVSLHQHSGSLLAWPHDNNSILLAWPHSIIFHTNLSGSTGVYFCEVLKETDFTEIHIKYILFWPRISANRAFNNRPPDLFPDLIASYICFFVNGSHERYALHSGISVLTLMDHSSIRQTFELGKFISIAGKSILNLVKCEVWLRNIVKCGKYSHAKFANFVYSKSGNAFARVIQKYTKFANFTWLYFPHFTIFCNQNSQFY